MAGPGQLFVIGLLVGVVLGVLLGSKNFIGCVPLALVPVATLAYVDWWLGRDPEGPTSMSGLLYLFVPIYPTAGALVGYGLIWLIRDWRDTKDL